MKLIKPNWVRHDGMSINSIDCHPTEPKIVTGGEDKTVRVWSTEAILDEDVTDEGLGVVTLLCKITNHTGPVNAVQFSSDGKYLASAGDDRCIIIWEQSATGGNTLDGDIENWILVKSLSGHNSDIRDVAWMPNDNKCLASCSIDSTIIVWRYMDGAWAECAKLSAHSDYVKGIAFDPIRKYLVSQSDDNTIRLWRVSDWHEEACVADLSETKSTLATFARPSFAPDGQFVCVPRCSSGGYPTAFVLRRDHWNEERDKIPSFVGHIAPVSCTKWSPRLYGSAQQYKTYCLLGARDNTLSLWTASDTRAIVAARDVFTDTVLDLAWSPCGLKLFACSLDGSVAVMQFGTDELGVPMSLIAQEKILQEKYGIATGVGLSSVSTYIPESIDQIHTGAKTHSPMKMPQRMAPAQPAIAPDDIKRLQRETKTADGKRRLAPTPMIIETQKTYLPTAPDNIAFGSTTSASTSTHTHTYTPTNTHTHTEPHKRTPAPAPAHTQTVGSEGGNPATTDVNTGAITQKTEDKQGSTTDKRTTIAAQDLQPNKRMRTDSTGEEMAVGGSGTSCKRKVLKKVTTGTGTTVDTDSIRVEKADEFLMGSVNGPFPGAVSRSVMLTPARAGAMGSDSAHPQPAAEMSVKVPPTPIERTIVIKNSMVINMQEDRVAMVTCIEQNLGGPTTEWMVYVDGVVCTLTASASFVAVACEDGAVHVFSLAGRRLLPCMSLEAPLHYLTSTNTHLLAVTVTGLCFVWHVHSAQAVVHALSVARLLSGEKGNATAFRWAAITRTGQPLFVTHNNKAWMHDIGLRQWVCVCDSHSGVHKSSVFHRVALPQPAQGVDKVFAQGEAMSLTQIQKLVTAMDNPTAPLMLNTRTQVVATQSDLDTQLANANRFGTDDERRTAYREFVRYHTDHNDLKRVRCGLSTLTAPLYRHVREADAADLDDDLMEEKEFAESMLTELIPLLPHNDPKTLKFVAEVKRILQDVQSADDQFAIST